MSGANADPRSLSSGLALQLVRVELRDALQLLEFQEPHCPIFASDQAPFPQFLEGPVDARDRDAGAISGAQWKTVYSARVCSAIRAEVASMIVSRLVSFGMWLFQIRKLGD